jgi:hypothetical protein
VFVVVVVVGGWWGYAKKDSNADGGVGKLQLS